MSIAADRIKARSMSRIGNYQVNIGSYRWVIHRSVRGHKLQSIHAIAQIGQLCIQSQSGKIVARRAQ